MTPLRPHQREIPYPWMRRREGRLIGCYRSDRPNSSTQLDAVVPRCLMVELNCVCWSARFRPLDGGRRSPAADG